MKILIAGATGQVGASCVRQFEADGKNDVLSLSRSDLDITNRNDVMSAVSTFGPDIVINGAAMTNVDACEDQVDQAFAINSFGVRNLVQASESLNAHLIHISTDFVFDGDIDRPYSEFDPTNPLSVYAKSKLGGDSEALSYSRSTVLRVAWVFGNVKGDFFSWVANGVKDGSITALIDDQKSTPTYSMDVAKVAQYCASHRLTGLINVANSGETTRLEMGRAVCDRLGIKHNLKGIPAITLNRPAPRPNYSSLSTNLLQRVTGIIMPTWQDALEEHVSQMQEAS